MSIGKRSLMLSRLSQYKLDADSVYWILGCIILIVVFAAIATEVYFLLALPILIVGGWITLVDYKKIFYLLFVSIPISIELSLPAGLSLNVLTEPLQILLSLITIVLILKDGKSIDKRYVTHPISITLLIHVVWICISTIFSGDYVVSIKYVLAKLWFILPSFYLTMKLIRSVDDVKKVIWCFLLPLLFTITVILIRHAAIGFSFDGVNYILGPFYSNHVLYASTIAIGFPFVWILRKWYPTYSFLWWFLVGSFVLMMVAIYLSYTRATMASVFIVFGMYFIVKWRWSRQAFSIGMLALFSLFFWLGNQNNFMNYTPNFERTITHQSFDNLLEATLRGQDISLAERYYRWIAGLYMVGDHPVMGSGPSTFYNEYKAYTLSSFKTYVSDNEEHSGIHNYFLMLLVEQGIPGLLFFLLFSYILFAEGERIYHQQRDPQSRDTVLAAIFSLSIMYSLLVINDMVEADKIGVMFFFAAGLLVTFDINHLDKEGSTKIHTTVE